MLETIAFGLGLVCATTIVHAGFMLSGLRFANWRYARHGPPRHEMLKVFSVAIFTAWMFIGVVSEALCSGRCSTSILSR
jgi:hypothetical protein